MKYWLPVILWMAIIFGFSTEAGSPRYTSRIIGPFLRWLIPGVTDATVYRVQSAVRKSAHAAEYALLALLLWRARRGPMRTDARLWHWRDAAFALVVAMLFAVSDEWHQSFVPSRDGKFADVLLDSGGAMLGLAALYVSGRRRKKW